MSPTPVECLAAADALDGIINVLDCDACAAEVARVADSWRAQARHAPIDDADERILHAHRLVAPSADDLRWTCSGCDLTTSAAFGDPVARHTLHLMRLASRLIDGGEAVPVDLATLEALPVGSTVRATRLVADGVGGSYLPCWSLADVGHGTWRAAASGATYYTSAALLEHEGPLTVEYRPSVATSEHEHAWVDATGPGHLAIGIKHVEACTGCGMRRADGSSPMSWPPAGMEHLFPAASSVAEPPPARLGRLKACVEAWPDAVDGEYHPSCCRFPKSCSADVYVGDKVAPADIEHAAAYREGR